MYKRPRTAAADNQESFAAWRRVVSKLMMLLVPIQHMLERLLDIPAQTKHMMDLLIRQMAYGDLVYSQNQIEKELLYRDQGDNNTEAHFELVTENEEWERSSSGQEHHSRRGPHHGPEL